MSALSTYLEDALINHVLRNSALATFATVYVALFTDDPTDAAIGTEVATGSYARQSVAFDAPTLGVTQNTSLITFPTATANWGVISHLALYDAASAGNMLYHSPMNTTEQVLNGQTFTIPVGSLIVSME